MTYYEKYVVLNPGKSSHKYGDLIDEDEFLDLDEQYGIDVASEKDIDEENYYGRVLQQLI